jgi:hypothetical protein
VTMDFLPYAVTGLTAVVIPLLVFVVSLTNRLTAVELKAEIPWKKLGDSMAERMHGELTPELDYLTVTYQAGVGGGANLTQEERDKLQGMLQTMVREPPLPGRPDLRTEARVLLSALAATAAPSQAAVPDVPQEPSKD